jgi:hypothetical protein
MTPALWKRSSKLSKENKAKSYQSRTFFDSLRPSVLLFSPDLESGQGEGESVKKPYLKKYGVVAGFTAWIVDGRYIREHIDEEFTNFGQHFRFRFIPKNEFWIDHEWGHGEEDFFIGHLLDEYRAMASGMSYDKALEKADRKEQKERKRSAYYRRVKRHRGDKLHERLLKSCSGKVQVWIINGEMVRDIYFIDFTEGGHHEVYPWIPKQEVWLDDDLGPREWKFVLLHELHERYLMTKSWPYYKAHRSASEIEHHCRTHPRDLDAKLRFEIARNE